MITNENDSLTKLNTAITVNDEAIYRALINGQLEIQITLPEDATIDDNTFARCSSLTSVIFSEGVTIGHGAFYKCPNLSSVTFSKGVTIESGAFEQCSSLTSLNFLEGMELCSSAFQNCKNLSSLTFAAGIKLSTNVFDGCDNLTSITFAGPMEVTVGTFRRLNHLTSVTFAEGMEVGDFAFRECENLSSITFAAGMKIGRHSFHKCNSLYSIKFREGMKLCMEAFSSCSNLSSVTFAPRMEIDHCVFSYCEKLEVATIPSSEITLSNYAFSIDKHQDIKYIITDVEGLEIPNGSLLLRPEEIGFEDLTSCPPLLISSVVHLQYSTLDKQKQYFLDSNPRKLAEIINTLEKNAPARRLFKRYLRELNLDELTHFAEKIACSFFPAEQSFGLISFFKRRYREGDKSASRDILALSTVTQYEISKSFSNIYAMLQSVFKEMNEEPTADKSLLSFGL